MVLLVLKTFKPRFMEFTELDELTHGKTIYQLEQEIAYQLRMGESKGGTIVSHLVDTLESLKDSLK
jgi:hypothetical protein